MQSYEKSREGTLLTIDEFSVINYLKVCAEVEDIHDRLQSEHPCS